MKVIIVMTVAAYFSFLENGWLYGEKQLGLVVEMLAKRDCSSQAQDFDVSQCAVEHAGSNLPETELFVL